MRPERPSQLFRCAFRAHDDRPDPRPAAFVAAVAHVDAAAPAAGRRRRLARAFRAGIALRRPVRDLQRPIAVAAPSGSAAACARQRGHVSLAGHLDQHGHALAQGGGRHPVGGGGQPAAGDVLGIGLRVGGRDDAGHPGRQRLRDGHQPVGPPGFDELLHLGGARRRGEDQRAALLGGAGDQHVAGVHVRGAGVDEIVVAVVEDHAQPQIAHRCVRRGPGAHDQPGGTVEDVQVAAVARLRAQARGQRRDLPRADQLPHPAHPPRAGRERR